MSRRLSLACCLSLIVQSAVVVPARGEEVPEAAKRHTIDAAQIDLSVPDAPAFAVLGLTPEAVINPTSPRALAGQLLNGVDPNGNFQTGIALDTSPYLLVYGNDVTLDEYNSSMGIRLASRTQLSLATAKGSSDDDEAVRVGLGFRLTPWDRGDPRQDEELLGCFGSDLRKDPAASRLVHEIQDLIEDGADPEVIEGKRRELNALTDRPATACRDAARSRNWNASSWTIGVAPMWISPNGNVANLTSDGGAFWTSVAYGFEELPGLRDNSQLLIGIRYNLNENVPDPDAAEKGAFLEQDTFSVAGQLRLAAWRPEPTAAPSIILAAEGDYFHADRGSRGTEDTYRGSLGIDLKIPAIHNTYLKIAFGASGGSSGSNNDHGFVMAGLRFSPDLLGSAP